MDLEDIKSDLNVLRKLYSLLQNDEDGLQNAGSINLDDKARLLLKKLLDGATERVFESYSKIIPDQWGTQLGPPKDTLKLELLASADDVSSTSPSVAQNSESDPSFHKTALKKDEQTPSELPSQAAVTEQLKLRIAASEPEKREKYCRVCHRRRVKQLNSAEEKNPSEEKTQNSKKDSFQHQLHNRSSHNLRVSGLVKGSELENMGIESASYIENQRSKRNREIQHNLTGIGSSHLSSIPTTEQEPVGTNSISKEVTDAIKQIELCILSLQLGAEHVVPLEKKNAAQHAVWKTMANPFPGTNSVTPIMQTKERLIRSELRQVDEFVLGRNDSLSQAGEFVLGTNDSPRQLVRRSVREPKGSSRVQQMPSQTVSRLKATKLPSKTNSQTSKPLPPSNYLLSQFVSQKVGRSKPIALVDDTASEVAKPIEGQKWPSRKASQFPAQNVNAIVEEVKSLSRVTSQNDHMPSQTHRFVQGIRVPPARNEIANGARLLAAKIPSQIDKENRDENRIPQLSHPSMPSQSVGSTNFMGLDGKIQAVDAGHMLRRMQNRGMTKRKKVLQQQAILRPSLLDQKPGQIMVPHPLSDDRMNQELSGAQKLNLMGQWRKIYPREQELEVSSSIASSSSTWTSQQASTSSGESVRSSLPGKSRTRHYMSPTSSSESEVYRLPDSSWSNPVDSTSSSKTDGYSLPSKARYHRVNLTGGSESDSYPPSDWTTASHGMDLSSQLMSSTSRRTGPSKNYRPGNRAIPERQKGRLRKLKDKLAIIFHHHHHHHHHLHHHSHDDDDDSHSDRQPKVGRATSLWKYAGRILHGAGKDEAHGKRMVEKLGKSVVRNAPARNQHGHFHTLVEGLLRHVRHSKKLKSSTGSVGRLTKGQHDRKKVAKKSHWWQILRHHRRVKLPNRPRVKLGYGVKKPQFRALPTMR